MCLAPTSPIELKAMLRYSKLLLATLAVDSAAPMRWAPLSPKQLFRRDRWVSLGIGQGADHWHKDHSRCLESSERTSKWCTWTRLPCACAHLCPCCVCCVCIYLYINTCGVYFCVSTFMCVEHLWEVDKDPRAVFSDEDVESLFWKGISF